MKALDKLAKSLLKNNQRLVTAESCTGGLIAKLCTDRAGSSQWFDRGFITYSNQSKVEMLKVEVETINKNGAVSKQVVEAMANGAIKHSEATCSIAVTGIAGPSGGSNEKPVGTVWIGWCTEHDIKSECYHFKGSREDIRAQAAEQAINKLGDLIHHIE